MRFIFRADASTAIGSGHVVRCATLAHMLRAAGHEVEFACRALSGDLIAWLGTDGFLVHQIDPGDHSVRDETKDAASTILVARGRRFDWVIVDHYGLGVTWESAMRRAAERICVIDDIGRPHDCDILLDQNYANPTHALYAGQVPAECTALLGPEFALLRPEFAKLRPLSLSRKRDRIARLLVCMGGGDPHNETLKVLNGLAGVAERMVQIDVVIGANNPNRDSIAAACAALPGAVMHVQTQRIAALLTEADCAICGAGNIALERCALGVPGLATIMADNQAAAAAAMHQAGAHRLLGWRDAVTTCDYANAVRAMSGQTLREMSRAAAAMCDGGGAARVAQQISELASPNQSLQRSAASGAA